MILLLVVVRPRKTSNRLLNLIQENVDQNRQVFRHRNNTTPRVMELDWTHPAHAERVLASSSTTNDGFDLVLASDVTYHSALHECLAQTMARLLSRRRRRGGGREATCLVAHQETSAQSARARFPADQFRECGSASGIAPGPTTRQGRSRQRHRRGVTKSAFWNCSIMIARMSKRREGVFIRLLPKLTALELFR